MKIWIVGALYLLFPLSVEAQPDIKNRLSNMTFDAYQHETHIGFKLYLSDYGLSLNNYPGSHNKSSQWQLEDEKLCIKLPETTKRNCYSLEISADKITAYLSQENGSAHAVLSLSNPQRGNRLNNLNQKTVAALNKPSSRDTQKQAESTDITAPSAPARVDDFPETRNSQHSLSIGATVRRIYFYVDKSNQTTRRTDDLSSSRSITYRTPYYYFSSQSRFGWYLESGYSDFDIKDVCFFCYYNTSYSTVKGFYLYVAPTLFMSLSNPWLKHERAGAWKMGLGAGPAYLKGSTTLYPNVYASSNHESIDYSAPGYIFNLFFDYRLSYFTLRFRNSYSRFEDGAYTYTIDDLAVETYLSFSF